MWVVIAQQRHKTSHPKTNLRHSEFIVSLGALKGIFWAVIWPLIFLTEARRSLSMCLSTHTLSMISVTATPPCILSAPLMRRRDIACILYQHNQNWGIFLTFFLNRDNRRSHSQELTSAMTNDLRIYAPWPLRLKKLVLAITQWLCCLHEGHGTEQTVTISCILPLCLGKTMLLKSWRKKRYKLSE